MFPWLPFLTFPESQFRLCRRKHRTFHRDKTNISDPSLMFITTQSPNYEFHMEYILPEQLNPEIGKNLKEKILEEKKDSLKNSLEEKSSNNAEKYIPNSLEGLEIISESKERLNESFLIKSKPKIPLKEKEYYKNFKSESKKDKEKVSKELELKISVETFESSKYETNPEGLEEHEDLEESVKKHNGKFIPTFECSISIDEEIEVDELKENEDSNLEMGTVRETSEKINTNAFKVFDSRLEASNKKQNSFIEPICPENKPSDELESEISLLTLSYNGIIDVNSSPDEIPENMVENTIPEDPIISRSSTSASNESPTPKTTFLSEVTPPTIRASKARRQAFETSSAMLELFGSNDSEKTHKVEDTPNKEEEVQTKSSLAFVESLEDPANSSSSSRNHSSVLSPEDVSELVLNRLLDIDQQTVTDSLDTQIQNRETLDLRIGNSEHITNVNENMKVKEDINTSKTLKTDIFQKPTFSTSTENSKAWIYRNSSSGLTSALFGISHEQNKQNKTEEAIDPLKICNNERQQKTVSIEEEKVLVKEQELEHPIDPSSTKTTINGVISMPNNKKKDLENEIELITRGKKSIKEAGLQSEAVKRIVADSQETKNTTRLYASTTTKNESNNPKKSLKSHSEFATHSTPNRTPQNKSLKGVESAQKNLLKDYSKTNNKLATKEGAKNNPTGDLRNQNFPASGGGLSGEGGAGMSLSNGANENSIFEDGGLQMENGTSNNNSGGTMKNEQIWFKNAQIINDDEIFNGDILIENGIISKIFPSDNSNLSDIINHNCEIIDASGYWILPAGIDVHTEFSIDNIGEEIFKGSKAALAGGTATIIGSLRKPKNFSDVSLSSVIDRIYPQIISNSSCNFAITPIFEGWNGEKNRAEMSQLVQEKGVNNFILEKCTDDVQLLNALEHAKDLGVQLRFLPENLPIIAALEKQISQKSPSLSPAQQHLEARPPLLEADLIHRICVLSQLSNAPFSILSISSSESACALDSSRKNGALVFAEVPIMATAVSSNSEYKKTRIPIRNSKKNSEAMLDLLSENQLCVCVSNYSSENQFSGKGNSNFALLRNRLSILWERGVVESGRLDPMRFVAVTSSNPAKMFNIYPKKGRVAVGADADLVLWDFDTERLIPPDSTPFDGSTVHATPILTVCSGRILWRKEYSLNEQKNDKLAKLKTDEVFLPLSANSPYVFSTVQLREKTFNLSKYAFGKSRQIVELNPQHHPAKVDEDSSRRTSIASSTYEEERKIADRVKSVPTTKQKPVVGGSRNRNLQSNDPPKRSATKVIQPPGGKSTGFW